MGGLAQVHGGLKTGWDLAVAERLGERAIAPSRAARLRALLDRAVSGSGFYRRLYGASRGADLALSDLPVTKKADLMAAFDQWVTDPAITRRDVDRFLADPSRIGRLHRGYFVCTSSGTTGDPGVFVYDRRAITVFRAMMIARVDAHWLSPTEMARLAARRFRWAAVAGAGAHFAGAGWMELERSRSRWRDRAYRLLPAQWPVARVVPALNAFDPGILTTYPSVLEMLTHEADSGRLRIRPVFIETSGETADPDAARGAAAAFGCPVHDAYACSEFLFLAFGCEHGWLHVNSDWAVLEPVDAHMRPVPPGEASHSVLLTNLANHVQPLIRYDMGDSVIERPDACPCGVRLPAIRVMGRRDDVMGLVDARGRSVRVAPLAIGSAVEAVPGVMRSQLAQTARSTVRLRVEASPGADAGTVAEAARDALLDFLAASGRPDVVVVMDPSPPRSDPASGKFRQVVVEPGAVQR
jgi:phenylacetate-CoA ligase